MSDSSALGRSAKLRLFGAFRLTVGNAEGVPIASKRARGLLAYLALATDKVATRERLCGLLWSDRGEAQARASLRQCLFELQDLLASVGLDGLDRRRDDVALHRGAFTCDVDDIRHAIDGGEVGALTDMLAMLGTDRLLEDLDIPGLFGEWVEQTRARLETTIRQGVLSCLEQLETARRWRETTALAEAYLNRDPLDETAAAAAIRADIALGATTTAHRRFQALQDALAREFGVSPGPMARDALVSSSGGEMERRPAGPAAPGAPIVVPGVAMVIVAQFDGTDPSPPAIRLAARLRDETLSGLSRFKDLGILTDPRPFDVVLGDPGAAREGAYVLGASVLDAQGGSALTARIATGVERRIIWSERCMPSAPGPGGVDGAVAKVVGAVLPIVQGDIARKRLSTGGRGDAALDMLALGLDARPATWAEAKAAAVSLEEMIRVEPGAAAPLLPLAYLYNTDFGLTRAGSSGPAEEARALDLAKTAFSLDRFSVHARTALGWCYLRRRQWFVAKLHFDEALTLNPFHVRRLMEIEFAHVLLDELDKARELADRCLFLNPASHDDYFTDLGMMSLIRGDHDLAESYFEVGATPEIWCHIYRAVNTHMAGRSSGDAARRAIARVRTIWPDERPLTPDALIGWISRHHPFRSEEVERRFLGAAGETFADL